MTIKSILMILFVTINTLASQLLLKKGVFNITAQDAFIKGWAFLFKAFTSPFIILAICLQGVGYTVWILVVSKVKLGIAFPISGAFFYILLAVASRLLFHERLTSLQWIGIIVLTVGVLMITLPTK